VPLTSAITADARFMRLALDEAEKSYRARGIPVGSVLTRGEEVIAVGRNRSREDNDPTSHGETDVLRNAGLRESYADLTLYTTLSPCMMCTGAMLFLGISKVVIGDRETYPGDVDFLLSRGMQVTLLDDPACIAVMRKFIAEQPDLWRRITTNERGDP
jgi:creatinine deaminase